jgi:hypothetical protein
MTTQISDWSDLDAVRNDLSGDYELVNDLDSNTTGYTGLGDDWTPIGGSGTYTLSFDGQGHSIEDLVVNTGNDGTAGLFGGDIFIDITVRNLALDVTVSVSGVTNTGGLVGAAGDTSRIENCAVAADITDNEDRASCLVGLLDNGTIADCYVNGTIDGGNAAEEIGGLVGESLGATCRRSYAVCSITNAARDAGAVGGLWDGDVSATYYDSSVEATGIDAGNAAGDATGLTTSEMQGVSAADNMPALTFYPTWSRVVGSDNADADGYPILRPAGLSAQDAGQAASITAFYQVVRNLALAASNDPDIDEATVTVTWDDVAEAEDGFRIYRSDVASPSFPGDFSQLTETIPDVEAFDDDGAAFDESYEYRVAAFESGVEAEPRAAATVSVGSPGPFNIVITGTNSPVGVGEELEIDVEITNTGSLGGETEATVELTEQ